MCVTFAIFEIFKIRLVFGGSLACLEVQPIASAVTMQRYASKMV